MRQFVTTVAELVGAALITVGAAMVAVPLGFVVGGAALVVFGFRAAPPVELDDK